MFLCIPGKCVVCETLCAHACMREREKEKDYVCVHVCVCVCVCTWVRLPRRIRLQQPHPPIACLTVKHLFEFLSDVVPFTGSLPLTRTRSCCGGGFYVSESISAIEKMLFVIVAGAMCTPHVFNSLKKCIETFW